MAGTALKTCSIRIKCKTGTLSSGADSTSTISLTGANQSAEAQTILALSDALESVISTPVIEILRRDDFLVSNEL